MTRFTCCACNASNYRRLHRSWWMKLLFSGRGFFFCKRCGRKMLVRTPEAVRNRERAERSSGN